MDSRDVIIKKEKLKLLEETPRIKQIIIDVLSYYDYRDRDRVLPPSFYNCIIEEVEGHWKKFIEANATQNLEQGSLFKK